jgi:hypothetical protein
VDAITITAQATAADLGFVNCHVSDNIFLNDTLCPADVGVGTPVTVAPADFNLAAGGSQIVTGSVGPLATNACNTASITCTSKRLASKLLRTPTRCARDVRAASHIRQGSGATIRRSPASS